MPNMKIEARKHISDDEERRIVDKLRDKELTNRDICRAHGISPDRLRQIAAKHGHEMLKILPGVQNLRWPNYALYGATHVYECVLCKGTIPVGALYYNANIRSGRPVKAHKDCGDAAYAKRGAPPTDVAEQKDP